MPDREDGEIVIHKEDSLARPSFQQRSQAITELLMQDPIIQEFREQHSEVQDTDLLRNMSRLYQYSQDQKNCNACPGLDQCPNDFRGHYCKLHVEAAASQLQIIDIKVPCAKQVTWQNQQLVRQRVKSFYVDEQALLDGYDAMEIAQRDKRRVMAVNQVFEYVQAVKELGLPTRGLYLEGVFGTGKTFLMGYMLYELAQAGYTGVIVYMPDFMEDLKHLMQDNQKLKETTDMLKECDLLVLDDIGAENLNPWARDHIIGPILNYRMNRKPTFYTSNYSLNNLEKHLSYTSKDGHEQFKGQRIMDRIRPYVDVIMVRGDNQRGGTTYLDSLKKYTR
ncbi:primosomal protein DnaI [Paenibacillus polymyxa]|uniref:primosomal protein DnaI n=1 Tax=Paenibacillus polymyxa TaxID=1406 RepID=UPI0025B6AC49|nr:primosomal protein DnaI [Paenibacillus polymyxa]MDN4090975.1 primosomal protein DnaI [Paenibacillus polymyxa]